MWTIGIDGGGTKCEAGLFDKTGNLVARALSGSANVFSHFDEAITQIELATSDLINTFNASQHLQISKQDCELVAGCAGGFVKSACDRFAKWQHPYAKARLTSDIYIASLAAGQGKACFLIIAGTGSCFALYENRHLHQFGGHGFVLGDIASGAWLGKNAISWYLQTLESKPSTDPLFMCLKKQLGENTQILVQQYANAGSGVFAKLVPSILTVVDESSKVQNWIDEGAIYIDSMIKAHNPKALPMYFVGGLRDIYLARLSALGHTSINKPQLEPVYGAYFYSTLFSDK